MSKKENLEKKIADAARDIKKSLEDSDVTTEDALICALNCLGSLTKNLFKRLNELDECVGHLLGVARGNAERLDKLEK